MITVCPHLLMASSPLLVPAGEPSVELGLMALSRAGGTNGDRDIDDSRTADSI